MGQDEKTDIALVREGRKGLGDGADLMIDAGLVWDSKTAMQRAIAFSEHNIFWLEEPLRPDDYDGYRKLAAATSVRIAAGEEESNRRRIVELMDRGRIDVVQVDLTRCGGFTEAMKIASLAWDRGLPVANHGFTTYVNVAAALHWLNAIPEHADLRVRRAGRYQPARIDHAPETARQGRISGDPAGAGVGYRSRRSSDREVRLQINAIS